MKYNFSELVDISKLQKLMEGLYLVSGILSAITDINGNILVCVGWRDICVKFHRVNMKTNKLCRQSDLYIKKYLNDNIVNSKANICYKCANGLIDVAAPICIDGKHLATVYTGQFLFEEPDIEQFRMQARKYGFNEEEYIDALKKVPIYTKEKVDLFMHFFLQLANMMAQMGLTQLRLIESQKKALQKSEERLKTIINNTPNVAIQSYDEHGKILFSNKASENIFGWVNEEIIGKTLDQLALDKKVVNEFLELLKTIYKTEKPYVESEWTFTNMKGIEKCIFSTAFPVHSFEVEQEFICMDIDITEKKRYEKEMYRLDQLKVIGQMASGIAHEVRNPMTTVRGLLQLLGQKERYHQDKEHFNLMIQELDRANFIITEFLSLAKNKAVNSKMQNFNNILDTLFPLIRADAMVSNKYIILKLNEIPDLLLDEKEIRQLVLNLTRNGFEAMDSGECITISTYVENGEVVLSVKDCGRGIPDDILDKIGTPFFTTKSNGTGLGLATCYSIAARHNATVNFDTGMGGTTFYVRFKIVT